MQKELFDILAEKYLDGEATEEERKLVEEYLHRLTKKDTREFSEPEVTEITKEIFQRISEKIAKEQAPVIPFYKKPFIRIAAAAAVVLILLSGYWLIFNQPDKENKISKKEIQTPNDFAPGHDGAILTLSNGKKIVLDNAHNGILTNQGNAEVEKRDGQLAYHVNRLTAGEVVYNTVATPKGRQFSLVLGDGSKVWLNAASSIRFPAAFAGNERRVEITGEAYFEVEHDALKPFKVSVNGMEVQVLGTHFNINAYSDEAGIKTTLLKGSVKIVKDTKTELLSPGQQLQLSSNGEMTITKNADIDETMAWKNGYFNFHNADIKTVMRQLSRWYDLDVSFQGNIPNQQFNGEIGRNLTLKEVLEGLAFTNVRFRIEEGRKLIILQ